MLTDTVADMIAASRNHNRLNCTASCRCYPLAAEIVALLNRHHAEDRNRLAEMLERRTTKLQRLERLVGEAS